MAARTRANYRWSIDRLFRSNVISATNPAPDTSKFLNKPVSMMNNGELMDTASLINLNKIINDVRNPLSIYKDKYQEYKNMENEVIVAAALRSYADDATVTDNIKGTPVWIESDDTNLTNELNSFLDSLQVSYKAWGWAYQIAQFGDLYLENIYNKHGYLTTAKPVSAPENILHIIDYEDDSEGFIVRRDERKTAVQAQALSEFDAYAMNKFTHFYLDDTPKVNSIIIQAHNDGSTISPLELTILRGRSILEPIRVNYRILRLLEDTIITNKIARAEYLRVFNIEVGESTGEGAARIVNKIKRLFDAKPRFDGNTGEYQSQRNYRGAADAIVNSTHKGVGAIDIKDVGGNVETQFIVDVEYFRSKLFAGLQIPKTFLGFEESLPTNPGDATLAKLDIRYTRAVRRVQLALIRGLEDLIDAYLISRGRLQDMKKYAVRMTNPSSAEELARLDETLKRLDVVDRMVDTVNQYGEGTVNAIQLYAELINEYIDSPRIKEIFENLTAKSIAISYLNINAMLNTARIENLESGRNLYSTIIELKADGLKTEEEMVTEQPGMPGEDDEFSSMGGGSIGGGSSPFDDLSFDDGALGSPEEMGDPDDLENVEGLPEEGEEDATGNTAGGAGGAYEPGDRGIPLGSLARDYDEENPIEAVGLVKQLGAIYRSSNANKLKLIDDLEKLAIYGPKSLRSTAESLTYQLSTEGFTDTNIAQAVDLFRSTNEYYNSTNVVTDSQFKSINEVLMGKNKNNKKAFFESLIKLEGKQ